MGLLDLATMQGVVSPPNSAFLQPLYGDPGFAHIVALQDERQARERKVILNIVCIDNLYEAVWQPHEGSYERLIGANGRRLRSILTQGELAYVYRMKEPKSSKDRG